MICYENDSTDPAFNMAVEEALLIRAGREPLFLLWENAPVVIVGRHQNVWSEVNLSYARQEKIRVIRRLSGGGAVYHDSGNLNYTFIVPIESGRSKKSVEPDFKFWSKPIINVLNQVGVDAQFSGRNDLTVEGKKFSGTAQVRVGGHLLHHGTLLFSTDFDKMNRLLTVDPEKFNSKGVSSVKARVANLSDYLPTSIGKTRFKKLLLDELSKETDLTFKSFSIRQLETIRRLKREKYDTPSWNLGQSPRSDFHREKRFVWGKLRVDVALEKGTLSKLDFSGDFFSDGDISNFTRRLISAEFTREELGHRISETDLKSVFPAMEKDEFISFLFD